MSAIGGIVDLRESGTEFEGINRMRTAMALRGRRRSTAYIGRSAALMYNSSKQNAFCSDEDKQPAIFERSGKEYVLCIDSEKYSSSAVFESYRLDGIELLGRLSGDFALAIYDGARRILILARDRDGKRPLYYRAAGTKVCFASEIRGVYAALGENASIDRAALSTHLTSPMGVCRASDIYVGVNELLAGECVIFSELGMSRFRYRSYGSEKDKPRTPERARVIEPYSVTSERSIDDALADSLIAFEYPRFDPYIPALCELLSTSGDRRVIYSDPIRRISQTYSNERADRLGSFYGVECAPAMPSPTLSFEASGGMYSYLCKRFCSLGERETALLCEILGRRKLGYIQKHFRSRIDQTKKEDAEQELCILGMLLQTAAWLGTERIVIRDGQERGIYSALSTI
jgi:hypothetical protein